MRVLFALLALVASVATVSAQGWTGPNFYLTGGDGTDYKFLINGTTVKDPSLNLIVGTTYKFFLNFSTVNHPFGFSTNGATDIAPPIEDFTSAAKGNVTISGACTPTAAGTAWYTSTPADVATNPCIISFTPPTNITGLSVYYRCSVHPNMVGTLTAVAAGGATTATPTTTSAPTGNGTTPTPTATPTTPTPTNPPGSSSSTGKNGAAVLVPGAAALLIAAINAIVA